MMDFWLAQLQNPAKQTMNVQQPMMQPHMPHEQQQPEMTSPLERGARQGMEAARQSMELSGQQQHRAFGRGLMEFAGNFNRPAHGPGIEGALGAINQALVPGVRAYADAQDREREFNAALLKREDDLAKERAHEARAEQERRDLQAYRMEHLNVERLKANREGRLTKEERLQQKIEERMKTLPEGAVPLESFPAGAQRDIMKDMAGYVSKGQKAKERMRIRGRMKKISDEYPDLANDFTRIIGENLDKGSIAGIFGGMFADQKKLSALQKMGKEQQELNRHIIEGQSAKLASNMYKEMVSKTTPGTKQTKEVVDYLIDAGNKEDKPYYDYGQKAKDAFNRRYALAPFIEEDIEPEAEKSTANTAVDNEKQAIIEELRNRGEL